MRFTIVSFYYRSQRSCGKVMFLHLPVILLTGSWSLSSRGLCLGGLCPGVVSVRGGLCPGDLFQGGPL